MLYVYVLLSLPYEAYTIESYLNKKKTEHTKNKITLHMFGEILFDIEEFMNFFTFYYCEDNFLFIV